MLPVQVSTRKKLRLFFEELKVEVTIMVFVIIYALFIFVDLAIASSSNVRRTSTCLPRWRLRAGPPPQFLPCPSSPARCSRPSVSWPTGGPPWVSSCPAAVSYSPLVHRRLLWTCTPAHRGQMCGSTACSGTPRVEQTVSADSPPQTHNALPHAVRSAWSRT